MDFNREVRPILSDKCFFCHGPDKEHRKAKLRLDLESSAKDQKKKYIIPGKPQDSELIYRLTTDDEDDLMPPPDSGKSLSPQEKKLLISQWIAEGASVVRALGLRSTEETRPARGQEDRLGRQLDRSLHLETFRGQCSRSCAPCRFSNPCQKTPLRPDRTPPRTRSGGNLREKPE